MEKRFREYLKHFEKLDYDVLSDEEIQDEKSNLELKMTVLHQELVRLLIVIMGCFLSASVFLATAFMTGSIFNYVCAVIMSAVSIYTISRYFEIFSIIKKLDGFVNKLTML